MSCFVFPARIYQLGHSIFICSLLDQRLANFFVVAQIINILGIVGSRCVVTTQLGCHCVKGGSVNFECDCVSVKLYKSRWQNGFDQNRTPDGH